MISRGPPWDILLAVEWTANVTPAVGNRYVNEGTHVIRIRHDRVAYLHAYEDSQKVFRACEAMATLGIDEAPAPPIID